MGAGKLTKWDEPGPFADAFEAFLKSVPDEQRRQDLRALLHPHDYVWVIEAEDGPTGPYRSRSEARLGQPHDVEIHALTHEQWHAVAHETFSDPSCPMCE